MSRPTMFEEIDAFSSFNNLTHEAVYERVPEDWWVVVADIAGSTAAIESGRYRDVNTLGAACIAAAQNAMDRTDFPYVFGGDGATLLIPPERFDAVARGLDGVRRMALEQFGMTLRVGAVAVSDVTASGHAVEVARYQESDELEIANDRVFADRCVAMFRGGGITVAEKLIKGDPERYEVPDDPANEADLTGLSCRWKPVPSQRGTILSILVTATSADAPGTLARLLERLDEILDGDMANANPIQVSKMGYKSVMQLVAEERRLFPSPWSMAFLRNVMEIVYAVAVFKYGLPAIFFDASRYASAIDTHSDFRKFDDQLRMVIDCTTQQEEAIRDLLSGLAAEGELRYGIHASGTAMMTCFVYGMSDGEHIHFVDGGDGGYAMAARELKATAGK